MDDTLDAIRTVAMANGCTIPDAPVYLNTSLLDTPPNPKVKTSVQDVYLKNYKILRRLRRKFDPDDVMQRAGGWVIPH